MFAIDYWFHWLNPSLTVIALKAEKNEVLLNKYSTQ
jgi:hypothetical protein